MKRAVTEPAVLAQHLAMVGGDDDKSLVEVTLAFEQLEKPVDYQVELDNAVVVVVRCALVDAGRASTLQHHERIVGRGLKFERFGMAFAEFVVAMRWNWIITGLPSQSGKLAARSTTSSSSFV
jgi:hypothetical protein